MLETTEIKNLYKEIQNKLYYMIPEKWESIYLYAAITEKAYNLPIGEMYFYYFPKGIIKKNVVNVYEIPAKFNIDEKQYVKLVKDLYGSIEKLRLEFEKNNHKLWTNITISIRDFRFKIEYNYEPINNNDFTNYERHIIWRYKYLGTDIDRMKKEERAIIEKYLIYKASNNEKSEIYDELIYQKNVNNQIVNWLNNIKKGKS